ncbi:UNVERIFIED_CONTAM: hypothetical protein Sindi_2595700 [Sesamum indicum]
MRAKEGEGGDEGEGPMMETAGRKKGDTDDEEGRGTRREKGRKGEVMATARGRDAVTGEGRGGDGEREGSSGGNGKERKREWEEGSGVEAAMGEGDGR